MHAPSAAPLLPPPRRPSLQQTSGETGSPPGPASLAGGSPTSTLPSGAGAGFTKLFGDVEIEFQPMHSYEQQEAEEAAAGGNGAAGASTSLAPLHGAGG